MKLFYYLSILSLINGFSFFNRPFKRFRGKKIKKDYVLENKHQLITIAPAGVYGFYELGVCDYLKKHYDLTNCVFSGASAGAWNSLYMSYNSKDDRLLSRIKFFNSLKRKSVYIKTKEIQLEKFVETKIASISTSPERNDTILIVDPFSG